MTNQEMTTRIVYYLCEAAVLITLIYCACRYA